MRLSIMSQMLRDAWRTWIGGPGRAQRPARRRMARGSELLLRGGGEDDSIEKALRRYLASR